MTHEDTASVSEFSGQTVIVTGGGSGVGAAAAQRFAAQGANVVIADMRPERLAEIEATISGSGAVKGVAGNVRVEADVEALVKTALDTFGRIDVICNNAGVPGPNKPVPTWEMLDEDWDRVFETNLRATLYMVRHAVDALTATAGRIVNTASVAGMVVWGSVAYGASKAALIHLTRGLAVELAPHGVRVNCVCPGMIATRFGEGLERPEARTSQVSIPLGRVAEAGEIAEAIVYLASTRSSYMTGAAVVLDGGYSVA